jgi:hypothetical protein
MGLSEMAERPDNSRYGTLVDGLRVATVIAPRSPLGWAQYVVRALAGAVLSHVVIPEMNVVVRRDDRPDVLYSEGPYLTKSANRRVLEIVVDIERIGAEAFVREYGPQTHQH